MCVQVYNCKSKDCMPDKGHQLCMQWADSLSTFSAKLQQLIIDKPDILYGHNGEGKL